MTDLAQARELAGYYALREYYEGRALPPAGIRAKIDALLRPFAPLDGPLMPILGLEAAIAELEARFPEAACAAHLTHVAAPPVPC